MNKREVTALVKQIRTRLGLTQEQLAQRIGVTYSTVNHWENGKRGPQPFLLGRLKQLRAEGEAQDRTSRAGRDDAKQGMIPEIQEMVDRIAQLFRPEMVILFGSHARGEARPDSDVDLLVVMPVRVSKRETQLAVRKALHDIRVPKDVIVTTPEDFEWRREVVGTVERPAWREGRVLYARR